MLKVYFSLVLLSFGLILQSCNLATTQNPNVEVSTEISPTPNTTPNEENLPQSAKVEFNGVSFNYNPQIFEVKSESIVHESPLRDESDKPGGEFPKHIVFTLEVKNKLLEPEAIIKIMPIADYRRMYAVSKGFTEEFDNKLGNLRKVIKDKSYRDKKSSGKGEIPFMPYYDAEQEILVKVNHLPFQSGKGIAFITQYTMEPSMINNEELKYFYEGITDDGNYYILAELPISVSFLPSSSDGEFEGYKFCYPYNEDSIKEYEKYITKVEKRLENLPQNEFEPNLDEFEKIISSLKVEK